MKKSFGYGRLKLFPENCEECKSKGLCTEEAIFCAEDSAQLVQKYLTKSIDLECLASGYPECVSKATEAAKIVANKLLSWDVYGLLEIIRSAPSKEEVASDNIPQFGDMSVAMYLVPEILSKCAPMGYVEFGKKLFFRENKNETACRKYGENHCKLATLLDIAKITKNGNESAIVSSSVMGRYFITLPSEQKDLLLQRLCLRIPIVQKALLDKDWRQSAKESLSILSETTRCRRMNDVMELIEFAIDE